MENRNLFNYWIIEQREDVDFNLVAGYGGTIYYGYCS